MLMPRVIPCLLLMNDGLVKTVRFKDPKYVGDPINAIKIFNEREVDELIFLDITATAEGRQPPFDMIETIATECFMPVCYGGGINDVEDMQRIFALGIEKVSLGAAAVDNPALISKGAERFGSQSIVVCIDVLRGADGRGEVVTGNAGRRTGLDPLEHATNVIQAGAGELLVNSVDRDGTMSGYDSDLIRRLTGNTDVPVIACGGAGSLGDIEAVVKEDGASSGAAGSLFVYYGKHRAVLINYPEPEALEAMFI
jgi:cyclase